MGWFSDLNRTYDKFRVVPDVSSTGELLWAVEQTVSDGYGLNFERIASGLSKKKAEAAVAHLMSQYRR